MDVYITKFVLERGIIAGTLKSSFIEEDSFTKKKCNKYLVETANGLFSLLRDDFEYSMDAALRKAEKVRIKEIKKTESYLRKLYQIKFV